MLYFPQDKLVPITTEHRQAVGLLCLEGVGVGVGVGGDLS